MSETDEKVEALAKEAHKKRLEYAASLKLMTYMQGRSWEELRAVEREGTRLDVTAVLAVLGCEDGGEVFVPDVRAAVAGLKRYCWRRCDTEYCAERVENCGVNVALLALTGGSDEG